MQIVFNQKLAASLPIALTIQVLVFVVYHLSMALVFEIEWVKLTLVYDWLRVLNWFVRYTILYVQVAVFFWMMFQPRYSKSLLL